MGHTRHKIIKRQGRLAGTLQRDAETWFGFENRKKISHILVVLFGFNPPPPPPRINMTTRFLFFFYSFFPLRSRHSLSMQAVGRETTKSVAILLYSMLRFTLYTVKKS
jgi:hypothetical protein